MTKKEREREKLLAKAARELGVPRETLTKTNFSLFRSWLELHRLKPKS